MTSTWRRRLSGAAFVVLTSASAATAQPSTRSGEEVYRAACAACHGADGRGAPRSTVGFETKLPDFTNCAFATAEPDVDWIATVHGGGPARGLDRNMPAFGDALSGDEIERVVGYARGFCRSQRWPSASLNLPRALVTEKAFPENEAFVTTSVPVQYTDRVETRFEFEQRIGSRSQYEVVVPFNVVKLPGGWNKGMGDVTMGVKQVLVHSAETGAMFSASVEMTFPTGKESEGLGNRLVVFEPSGAFSQALPFNMFLHAQVGIELPVNLGAALDEGFWRAAIGKTFTASQWGRLWSPIVEVLGSREIEFGEPVRWDLAPQFIVTLSKRQHVMASGGARLPMTVRGRSRIVMASLLWEWSQGGFFSGW